MLAVTLVMVVMPVITGMIVAMRLGRLGFGVVVDGVHDRMMVGGLPKLADQHIVALRRRCGVPVLLRDGRFKGVVRFGVLLDHLLGFRMMIGMAVINSVMLRRQVRPFIMPRRRLRRVMVRLVSVQDRGLCGMLMLHGRRQHRLDMGLVGEAQDRRGRHGAITAATCGALTPVCRSPGEQGQQE